MNRRTMLLAALTATAMLLWPHARAGAEPKSEKILRKTPQAWTYENAMQQLHFHP